MAHTVDALPPTAMLRGVFAGAVRPLRSPRAPGRPPTPWRSAILKAPRHGDVAIGALGLEGDAQHDRRHHGGPAKAVLCYGAAHYAAWAPLATAHLAEHGATLATIPDSDTFGPGAFGENLLVDGLDESTTCLGDRWRVGGVVLRITEPRGPCGTLARRWAWPALVGEVRRTARAGWYCAVDVPGTVRIGDRVELLERVAPAWTVARAFHLLEARVASRSDVEELLASPGAHEGLRERLARRLATAGRTR